MRSEEKALLVMAVSCVSRWAIDEGGGVEEGEAAAAEVNDAFEPGQLDEIGQAATEVEGGSIGSICRPGMSGLSSKSSVGRMALGYASVDWVASMVSRAAARRAAATVCSTGDEPRPPRKMMKVGFGERSG